jgi:F-type H+-transporting ATPase subunit gamma
MGAAGLIEIKRRLKSIESTKKITKAMGLVATSKLRKSRKELKVNEEFASIAKRNMEIVSSIADDELEVPNVKSVRDDLILYIIISSDSGLCGGYNNNVVSHLKNIVGSNRANARVITLGKKGISYLNRAGFNTLEEYVDIPDVPTIKEVDTIYKRIMKLCTEQNISKVNVVYTEFHSPVKFMVKSAQLLPIEKVKSEVRAELIEPNLDIVYKESLDMYLKGKLRSCILSAKCSEQGSRMSAMNGATSNAEDIISALNSKYNRIRQTMITQEISEIVGGAEAQK